MAKVCVVRSSFGTFTGAKIGSAKDFTLVNVMMLTLIKRSNEGLSAVVFVHRSSG